jgi:hypothetical protein
MRMDDLVKFESIGVKPTGFETRLLGRRRLSALTVACIERPADGSAVALRWLYY